MNKERGTTMEKKYKIMLGLLCTVLIFGILSIPLKATIVYSGETAIFREQKELPLICEGKSNLYNGIKSIFGKEFKTWGMCGDFSNVHYGWNKLQFSEIIK